MDVFLGFRKILMVLTLLLSGMFGWAQQSPVFVQVYSLDEQQAILEELKLPERYPNQNAYTKGMNELLGDLYDQSYLAASIDSIARVDSLRQVFVHIGKAYEWASLKNGNVEETWLDQVGFREKLYGNKPFNYQEVRQLQADLITYAENNGFPFASVWLDSIHIQDGQFSARIYLQQNRQIDIEGIEVRGEAKISAGYLSSYLGIRPTSVYDESQIKKVRSRIRELAFIKETQNLTVTFLEDNATVNLFLDNKRASRFDFLIGFLPRNEETGGLILTGNAEIDLFNPFGTGKRLRFQWQQLRPGTQELELHFLYPYVLSQPFGVDFTFNLYKRDSSYLDLIRDFGVQYHFEGHNYVKAFWDNRATNVLNIDTDRVLATRQLPTNLDVTNSTFGLAYNWQQLDYRFNPRKGWDVMLRGGAGVKRIRRNNKITDLADPEDPLFDFATLYDSLQLRSFQYRLDGHGAYYWPIGKRSTLKSGAQFGFIQTGEALFQNELYRIGGTQTLRGFDEESL
ncbi:MAG: BamA/TamA family outer membrane protein, partial [Bacteroidota bacterium]